MKAKVKKKVEESKRPKMNIVMAIVLLVLLVYAISIVGMLAWGFLTSLRSGEAYNNVKLGWPSIYLIRADGIKVPLEKYSYAREALFGKNFLRAMILFEDVQTFPVSFDSIFGTVERPAQEVTFLFATFNTLFYAGVGSLVYSFVCMTVAYLCSKYKYKFSKFLYGLNLVVMTIPIVGSQPSMMAFMQDTALYDSYLGMFLQKVAFTGMYFFVFKAFFDGIADSYIEAAEIDGANQLSCYLRIMAPLAVKMFATVFMLQFIALWNDYQTPLLYFPTHTTLSYAVYQVTKISQGDRDWTGVPNQIAACMLFAIPVLVLFIIFSKRIMGDVSMGGLKE